MVVNEVPDSSHLSDLTGQIYIGLMVTTCTSEIVVFSKVLGKYSKQLTDSCWHYFMNDSRTVKDSNNKKLTSS